MWNSKVSSHVTFQSHSNRFSYSTWSFSLLFKYLVSLNHFKIRNPLLCVRNGQIGISRVQKWNFFFLVCAKMFFAFYLLLLLKKQLRHQTMRTKYGNFKYDCKFNFFCSFSSNNKNSLYSSQMNAYVAKCTLRGQQCELIILEILLTIKLEEIDSVFFSRHKRTNLINSSMPECWVKTVLEKQNKQL